MDLEDIISASRWHYNVCTDCGKCTARIECSDAFVNHIVEWILSVHDHITQVMGIWLHRIGKFEFSIVATIRKRSSTIFFAFEMQCFAEFAYNIHFTNVQLLDYFGRKSRWIVRTIYQVWFDECSVKRSIFSCFLFSTLLISGAVANSILNSDPLRTKDRKLRALRFVLVAIL